MKTYDAFRKALSAQHQRLREKPIERAQASNAPATVENLQRTDGREGFAKRRDTFGLDRGNNRKSYRSRTQLGVDGRVVNEGNRRPNFAALARARQFGRACRSFALGRGMFWTARASFAHGGPWASFADASHQATGRCRQCRQHRAQPDQRWGQAAHIATIRGGRPSGSRPFVQNVECSRPKPLSGGELRPDSWSLPQERLELLLGQNGNSQLLGLFQFAAGLVSGDHIVGVLGNARCGPSP